MKKIEPTIKIEIYIAGDLDQARNICKEWCMEVGACVTVDPTEYIYTGGAETGVRIGLINYPRFPTTYEELLSKAEQLSDRLMRGLFQHSYSIVTPSETIWFSRRPV